MVGQTYEMEGLTKLAELDASARNRVLPVRQSQSSAKKLEARPRFSESRGGTIACPLCLATCLGRFALVLAWGDLPL
jgi:hypothetical protein